MTDNGEISAVVGGRVITRRGLLEADLTIAEGRILSIDERLRGRRSREAQRTQKGVVDASGCLVIPGGVDPHCHLMEDVRDATRAAALGGTTTVLSFTNPATDESALECAVRCREEIRTSGPMIDVGLHAMLYDPDRVSFEELESLQQAGVSAVKVFLAYPELGIMWSVRGLFELMTTARRLGLIVQVHCENGPLIEALVDSMAASGRRDAHCFVETRPPEVEAEAVAETLAIASLTGATSYLVHLSSGDAMELVRLAKRRGTVPPFAETCVHYLALTDDSYGRDDLERYLVAPPLRAQWHQDALWDAIGDGTLDTVGSDHCQTRSLSLHRLSPDGDGFEYGLAGVGARLPMLLSEGLARGVPIERLVEVGCTAPARVFGHFPSKGVLTPGSDADIVVLDPDRSERVLDKASFEDGTGDSVYAGQALTVNVRCVIARGRVVVDDGELVTAEPGGRYLPARGPG